MKTINNVNLAESSAYAKPMKWHKFLIYFSLWLSAILFITAGIGYLSGTNYGDQIDAVYSSYPGLKTIDLVFGFSYLFLGVFYIITRFKLAKFQSNAIACLTLCYILPLLVGLLYLICYFKQTKLLYSSDVKDLFSQSIASIVILILTRLYYKKRSELFEKQKPGRD